MTWRYHGPPMWLLRVGIHLLERFCYTNLDLVQKYPKLNGNSPSWCVTFVISPTQMERTANHVHCQFFTAVKHRESLQVLDNHSLAISP